MFVSSQVRVVTCKSTDVVSVALHECNYDVNQAIQNILDGNYDFSDVCSLSFTASFIIV